MTSLSRRSFASTLLLLVCAAAAHGQLPERSAFDEHYAPVTLRGVKNVRVSAHVQVLIPEPLGTPKLQIPEARTRVEALLKRADIGYLTDAAAEQRPDAPVLRLERRGHRNGRPCAFAGDDAGSVPAGHGQRVESAHHGRDLVDLVGLDPLTNEMSREEIFARASTGSFSGSSRRSGRATASRSREIGEFFDSQGPALTSQPRPNDTPRPALERVAGPACR